MVRCIKCDRPTDLTIKELPTEEFCKISIDRGKDGSAECLICKTCLDEMLNWFGFPEKCDGCKYLPL